MLLRLVSDFRLAMDLSLVLDAEGIPHELKSVADEQWALFIDDGDSPRAELALAAFERENPPRRAPALEERGGLSTGLCFGLGLIAFFVWTEPRSDADWFARGSADAEAILRGEWWRTLTALSLHADAAHAVGNACIGGLLLGLLSRRTGSAAAVWLMLLAGAAGTGLTALVVRHSYVSVGASTAVFGALGTLVVLRARDPDRKRQAWVYLGAGLALLGFLGTGKRADLLGHLFGFLLGGLLAAPLARTRPPRRPFADALGACLAPLAVALAWWRAFR